MPGTVALCGGNEFEPDNVSFNRAALRAAKANRPQVVILPVASADNPRKAARAGVATLTGLGARVEAILIADRAMANDPLLAAPIETAQVVYLPDGNPLAAVQTLRETETLAHLVYRWQQGAVLAASGAAAMALCDFYWDSGVWEPGLGLLKNISVLPHHEHIAGRFSPDRLLQNLPKGITLIGLDASTGILLDGLLATVHGQQEVTRYRSHDDEPLEATIEFTDGESFRCDYTRHLSPGNESTE